MLYITIPENELFDEMTSKFIKIKETKLCLEHSLVSISKWEAKWKVPFLDNANQKTAEQTLDYIKCMTLTQNVDPLVYLGLSEENLKQISDYIEDPRTATTINDKNRKSNARRGQIITSEVIYGWMVGYQIPVQFEKWHISRLLTLIRVCEANNNPKKMSKREVMAQNRALNAQRKARHHTRG